MKPKKPHPRRKLFAAPTSRTHPAYPFVPKTNAFLIPGQFWAIPLSDGRFACGRVLDLPPRDLRYGARTAVYVGLSTWCGDEPPTADAIAGAKIFEHGSSYLKTIRETGGKILGWRSLAADRITIGLMLTDGTLRPKVKRGFEEFGFATRSQLRRLEIGGGWGFKVIEVLAEMRFVEGLVPPPNHWDRFDGR